MWWPFFELLYRNYWRVESTGVDHVPGAGRAMIVANHSGGSYAWDAVMMSTALHLEHRRPRYIHYVSTEFFYDTPFLSFDNRNKRAALACRADFVRRIEFCEPIDVSSYGPEGAMDTLLVQQITEQVRSRSQEGLDRNLGLRKTMFW